MGRVELTHEELELMLDRAARKGAREALHELGLHDEQASRDINDLRNLLASWRATKRDIRSTVVKTLTTAFLVFLTAAVGFYVQDRMSGQ